MDMLNKLKKRVLEDNEESESEAKGGGGAGPHAQGEPMSDDPATLQKEIAELKEHINKNYFVYVRRLEKRKERIKELEEYSKALLGDNERVNGKLKDYEDCQKQLKDYRDNLEQLEGFQSQELAKVKHMLLSAETALEKETQTRKKLEEELHNAKANATSESNEAVEALKSENKALKDELNTVKDNEKGKVEELTKTYEEKLARLEERLGHQDLGEDERLAAVTQERDNLDNSLQKANESLSGLKTETEETAKRLNSEVERLKGDLEIQKKKTATLTAERDQAKNALLEHEIAQHEKQANLGAEKEKVNLDLARLNTEKETLEVTLERRDKELKAKKEEFRESLAKAESVRDEAVKQLEAKALRISALDAEKELLKGKLVEESNSLLSTESRLEQVQGKLTEYEKRFVSARDESTALRKDLLASKQSEEEAKTKLELLEDKFDALNTDYDKIVIQLDETMSARSDFQTRWKAAEEKVIALGEEVKELKAAISEMESTFSERVEQSELVQGLKKRVGDMEDELSDKKNIIKVHQQKMNDMKKTFQKEMRSSAERSASGVNGHHSPTPPPSSMTLAMAMSTPSTASSKSRSPPKSRASPNMSFDYDPNAVEDMVPMTDVNVRYLKHVIFKFFTSREYEAKNLTKAMAALLHFTRDEEKLFQEHLVWKMSWFGTKPKLGSGQFALSIDPS